MENSDKSLENKLSQIASRLKELRKQKYKSHETFAFEHEINRVQYWRVEKGENITLKTLLKILEIHKISLKDFFSEIQG